MPWVAALQGPGQLPAACATWEGGDQSCYWISRVLYCLQAAPAPATPPAGLQAKMREAEERRKQEAAAEKERRLQKNNAAGNRPKFSFKLGA